MDKFSFYIYIFTIIIIVCISGIFENTCIAGPHMTPVTYPAVPNDTALSLSFATDAVAIYDRITAMFPIYHKIFKF